MIQSVVWIVLLSGVAASHLQKSLRAASIITISDQLAIPVADDYFGIQKMSRPERKYQMNYGQTMMT